MASKWDWLRQKATDLFREEGKEMVQGWVDAEMVDLDSDSGYFVTIRLIDMHLGRSRDWGRDRAPLLQSVVDPPSSDVEVPMTIGPSSFNKLEGGTDTWQWTEATNVPLTGPLPFDRRRGELHLLCGLLYVKGSSVLSMAAGFLGKISSLAQVPQLSVASGVAKQVADGAEQLISIADPQGRVALEFGLPWDDLRRGYLVAAGADTGDYELGKFSVNESKLLYDGSAENVRDLDYFLLRVDLHADIGESWSDFSTINEPFQESIRLLQDARGDVGVEERSQAEVMSAISAAIRSPDLTVGERRRIGKVLWSRWSEAKQAFVPPAEMLEGVAIDLTFEELVGRLLEEDIRPASAPQE